MPVYKIIATDQTEYGPATADQVRQWIAEGLVNAQGMAMSEGETEWKPLTAFPEFVGALARAAGSALPAASVTSPQPPGPNAAPAKKAAWLSPR